MLKHIVMKQPSSFFRRSCDPAQIKWAILLSFLMHQKGFTGTCNSYKNYMKVIEIFFFYLHLQSCIGKEKIVHSQVDATAAWHIGCNI